MDSGNSGSLQSSSGAEDEGNSRAAVNRPPPPHPAFNHHVFEVNNPLFFMQSTPQHQLHNLDSVVLPSFSDHQFLSSSSSQPSARTVPFPPVTEPITSTNPPPTRNPKKRSRASRRAPTTVLTTDTTNFRAMVQEFTGIPAPPFISSSPASFDIFSRPSAMMRSNTNNFDNLPPHLLRPFPQKLQSSSSSISSLLDSMQNTISFPSNSLNQSLFLNPKITQNVVTSVGYSVIAQSQIHHELQTTNLPDLVSTAPTAARTNDQVVSGNWDGGGKKSSSTKGDQGFVEPWICSSD